MTNKIPLVKIPLVSHDKVCQDLMREYIWFCFVTSISIFCNLPSKHF